MPIALRILNHVLVLASVTALVGGLDKWARNEWQSRSNKLPRKIECIVLPKDLVINTNS